MPPTNESACAILTLGRFMSPPDVDTLIRALARLSDLDWHLYVAVGPEWHDAQPSATARALDVAAQVTFATAPDWATADLFACAAEPPDLDLAASEALRHGLPVIAMALEKGAHITLENGVACPPGDVEQLSKAIRRLIFDAALRGEFAAAARTTKL